MTKCQVIAIDNQKGGVISEVMNKLDISDKKYQFLSFMNKKRNTILSVSEIFQGIKTFSI